MNDYDCLEYNDCTREVLNNDEKKIPFKMLVQHDFDLNHSKISLNIHPNSSTTWLDLWLKDKSCIKELYYSSDKRRNYKVGQTVFSFFKLPEHNKWLLINVATITSNPEGSGFHHFVPLDSYKPLFGRLIIDYYKGNTHQVFTFNLLPILKDIYIYQILPTQYGSKPFPGYGSLHINFRELRRLIDLPDWKSSLIHVSGIYLINHVFNNKKYVGVAYGVNGLYGRWKAYLERGYDSNEEQSGEKFPNSQLKEIATNPFQGMTYIETYFYFSVLETIPIGYDLSAVLDREKHWKNVLNTKDGNYGYNSN